LKKDAADHLIFRPILAPNRTGRKRIAVGG
jgi:hypothetical protein